MPRKLTTRGAEHEIAIAPVSPAAADPVDDQVDDQEEDLPFFGWAGRVPSFFEWAGAEPRLTGELEVDVEAVHRAIRTFALMDAMSAFYGDDLFWAAVFGIEVEERGKPRVDPRAAYDRLPKGTLPARG